MKCAVHFFARGFFPRSLSSLALTAAVCFSTVLGARDASAESRTYVRSWFGQAMYSTDNDCPGGVNPAWNEQRLKDLVALGYSETDIAALLKDEVGGGPNRGKLQEIIETRGRIDGKPVNPYSYPATVIDPKLHSMKGRYAYGFNLDGRGAASPNGFEDPDTHEKGINNELARALGCMREFRGSLTTNPLYWDWTWGQLKGNEPAWLITVTGDDLSKDGDVTLSIDRAVEHLQSNTDGSARRDATYRLDPDPRSHNVYKAKISDGMLITDEPVARDIRMLQDPLVAMEFRMKNVHVRMKFKPDQSAEIMIGGYQPWSDLYYSFAGGGGGNESCSTGDMPGIFYLFRKFADAEPDPVTGQNAAISATYYLEAVPAFAVPAVRNTAAR